DGSGALVHQAGPTRQSTDQRRRAAGDGPAGVAGDREAAVPPVLAAGYLHGDHGRVEVVGGGAAGGGLYADEIAAGEFGEERLAQVGGGVGAHAEGLGRPPGVPAAAGCDGFEVGVAAAAHGGEPGPGGARAEPGHACFAGAAAGEEPGVAF